MDSLILDDVIIYLPCDYIYINYEWLNNLQPVLRTSSSMLQIKDICSANRISFCGEIKSGPLSLVDQFMLPERVELAFKQPV
jgi:hypothetical protein